MTSATSDGELALQILGAYLEDEIHEEGDDEDDPERGEPCSAYNVREACSTAIPSFERRRP